ncbi:hypothetical protein RI129_002209 [Pyrocoelia pectoralis]|uniref:mRNA m(6)A methyltransferase n=1 Tax=Pyrocoelia pectoralis TaxID=417401 RepID=A0AAN7ZLW4_9COLE
MSDAWEEIQAIKSKRNSLRERLEKRKKERQDILGSSLGTSSPVNCLENSIGSVPSPVGVSKDDAKPELPIGEDLLKVDPELERELLKTLNEVTLQIPISSTDLVNTLKTSLDRYISHGAVSNLLQKFETQKLIHLKDVVQDGKSILEVVFVEHSKLNAVVNEATGELKIVNEKEDNPKRKRDESPVKDDEDEEKRKKEKKDSKTTDIFSLLAMPSTKEKESKKVGEEILDLLSKPTAKERSLAERFRSQGGAQVMEFCPHGTKAECQRNASNKQCKKLHFKKIIQKHTDESLGDCSFLNTCFHMDTCKYVHYEVDRTGQSKDVIPAVQSRALSSTESTTLYPPQWVQCDLRYLDMTALGKFAVIMADPPWDIHMELPYGTMSDDEMRQLGIPQLQDEGLIFLWVTGRAMELGRECLKLWGYERVDEIIWVKTNQLQRIIRTGRTGHWLNHGKEHCLVGMKGSPQNLNRGLDSDVIVAEVRATSHKPDEIYGMIERLSPGTRKIELFGRPHNIQPNWITLGNQVDGIRLVDPVLIENFKKRYPDGNCMAPPPNTVH